MAWLAPLNTKSKGGVRIPVVSDIFTHGRAKKKLGKIYTHLKLAMN